MKLEDLSLKRLTVHRIFASAKSTSEPFAEECKEIGRLDNEGMNTLHERINTCLNHKTKFFELTLGDSTAQSFFAIQKLLFASSKQTFLKISQQIADKCALAHRGTNAPDGLMLLAEATINGLQAVIVIKAEKSNAFSVSGTDLQLVKDVFLSSDKTLYKIGLFLRKDTKNVSPKSYRYYVYDDVFSPYKGKLSAYFYNVFLGLNADENGKILTSNLYRSLTNFMHEHIEIGDRYELSRHIDRYLTDPRNVNLNASDFKYLFPAELEQLFESVIESEYPSSFVKDESMLKSIDTKRIALTDQTTLILKNPPHGVVTGRTSNEKDWSKLRASLDSGANFAFALIPTLEISDRQQKR